MPALRNLKYEAVAQAVAAGASQINACRAAGFKMKQHAGAHRIVHRPEIQVRIKELMRETDHALELRDTFRQRAAKGAETAASPVTKEYLMLELQTQLAQ